MENNQQQSALSVGGWIGTLIVMAIPIVNIVMLFVWGLGNGDIGRKRFCIASLILAAIVLVLYIILWLTIGITFMNVFNNIY